MSLYYDERTLTRLSYLFSSMACSSELSMRFIAVAQENEPIERLTTLEGEIVKAVGLRQVTRYHLFNVVSSLKENHHQGDKLLVNMLENALHLSEPAKK